MMLSSDIHLFVEECLRRVAHSFSHVDEDSKRLDAILGVFEMLSKRMKEFEGNAYVVRKVTVKHLLRDLP